MSFQWITFSLTINPATAALQWHKNSPDVRTRKRNVSIVQTAWCVIIFSSTSIYLCPCHLAPLDFFYKTSAAHSITMTPQGWPDYGAYACRFALVLSSFCESNAWFAGPTHSDARPWEVPQICDVIFVPVNYITYQLAHSPHSTWCPWILRLRGTGRYATTHLRQSS